MDHLVLVGCQRMIQRVDSADENDTGDEAESKEGVTVHSVNPGRRIG